jgi:hypothetical protein
LDTVWTQRMATGEHSQTSTVTKTAAQAAFFVDSQVSRSGVTNPRLQADSTVTRL